MFTPMGAPRPRSARVGAALSRRGGAHRLIVLGVSPTHPSLQPPLRAVAVKFRSHDGKNLLNTSVSGKKKSGAVFLTERDMVCTVEVSDGSSFML